MKKFYIILIISSLILGSCASTYRPIYPEKVNYTSNYSKDGIELHYRYDVLRDRRNTRYSKNEFNSNIKIVSVKITNYTDTTIVIGKDIVLFSKDNQISFIPPHITYDLLRQPTSPYLWYYLLAPIGVSSNDAIPVGFFAANILALGNIIKGVVANRRLEKDLKNFNIINKSIKKGETVFGVIAFSDSNGYVPINFKWVVE
jgi:hypothetical protein